MNAAIKSEDHRLRQANIHAGALLRDAAAKLLAILEDKDIMTGCHVEIWDAMDNTLETMEVALRHLEAIGPPQRQSAAPIAGGPTPKQGQFLAFIREYMMRNHAREAPTHATFQRFFNLTPPSVNSMLIRLEQRGFIRRVPHQARAIELTIAPGLIPPLDRPFKF